MPPSGRGACVSFSRGTVMSTAAPARPLCPRKELEDVMGKMKFPFPGPDAAEIFADS